MDADNVVPLPKAGPKSGNMLVPTDGSALSLAAALKAVAYAWRLQARLVAFHAIPTYQYPVYVGGIPFEYPSEADYESQCRTFAGRYLDLIAEAASDQGVAVGRRIDFDANPAHAIVEAVAHEDCNLIFMGSHGRSGLSRLFLGSVALKTLTLAHIPVLVDHPSPQEIASAEAFMERHAVEA